MARQSAAQAAGLDAKLSPLASGKWRIVLTDAQDSVVFDRTYATEHAAKVKAREWVRQEYNVETEEVRRPRGTKPRPNLGPTPVNLIGVMRARADDNETRAISLRHQADTLESEAKRLRAGADALEGPDGET